MSQSIFGVKLSGIARGLIVLFTLIEVITLTVWAVLLFLAFEAYIAGNMILFAFWFILSILELFGGLEIEHTIATVTGHK